MRAVLAQALVTFAFGLAFLFRLKLAVSTERVAGSITAVFVAVSFFVLNRLWTRHDHSDA